MTQFSACSLFALLALATSSAQVAFAADGASLPQTPPQAASAAPNREISKEQAIDMALKAHPGEVVKAYEDTKRGKKTWEVRIKGNDGKKWEIYYEIKTGALVAEESR